MPSGNIRSTRSLSEESDLIIRLTLMVLQDTDLRTMIQQSESLVMDRHLPASNQDGMLCMSLRCPFNNINSEYVRLNFSHRQHEQQIFQYQRLLDLQWYTFQRLLLGFPLRFRGIGR